MDAFRWKLLNLTFSALQDKVKVKEKKTLVDIKHLLSVFILLELLSQYVFVSERNFLHPYILKEDLKTNQKTKKSIKYQTERANPRGLLESTCGLQLFPVNEYNTFGLDAIRTVKPPERDLLLSIALERTAELWRRLMDLPVKAFTVFFSNHGNIRTGSKSYDAAKFDVSTCEINDALKYRPTMHLDYDKRV